MIEAFCQQHATSLERLRKHRNQQVTHSEFVIYRKGAKSAKTLPSMNEFEAFFDFAADFYRLVSDGLLGIGPTGFAPYAGTGLVRTLRNLGLVDARFYFAHKPTA